MRLSGFYLYGLKLVFFFFGNIVTNFKIDRMGILKLGTIDLTIRNSMFSLWILQFLLNREQLLNS